MMFQSHISFSLLTNFIAYLCISPTWLSISYPLTAQTVQVGEFNSTTNHIDDNNTSEYIGR